MYGDELTNPFKQQHTSSFTYSRRIYVGEKPQALSCEKLSQGHIRLSWQAGPSDGVFLIFRSEDGVNFKYHALTVDNDYIDSRLSGTRKYYYRVCLSTLEGISESSNAASVSQAEPSVKKEEQFPTSEHTQA